MTTTPRMLEESQKVKFELGDYTEFYSHLAIQARRASRVALVACAVALISIAAVILAQLRPPILLRVQDGHVSSLDGSSVQAAETAAQQQPDSAEKLAFVNAFLNRFVNIDPLTVKRDTNSGAQPDDIQPAPADSGATQSRKLRRYRPTKQRDFHIGGQIGRVGLG